MSKTDQGVDFTRWMVIPRTLCFIRHGEDVLLLKRGLHKRVFPGKFNGVGGHLEHDEDLYSSMLREIHEETALEVRNLCLRGIDHIDTGEAAGIMLFIFSADAASRQFIDTEEGTLHWIPIADVLRADTSIDMVFNVDDLINRLYGPQASIALFYSHTLDTSDHYGEPPLVTFAKSNL